MCVKAVINVLLYCILWKSIVAHTRVKNPLCVHVALLPLLAVALCWYTNADIYSNVPLRVSIVPARLSVNHTKYCMKEDIAETPVSLAPLAIKRLLTEVLWQHIVGLINKNGPFFVRPVPRLLSPQYSYNDIRKYMAPSNMPALNVQLSLSLQHNWNNMKKHT